ncbi:transcriptional adapter 2-beta isoform X1 [Ananas comosus]|uniref:Transcriptional adapter 2-beta isoform X1 n=1 Tax=Ananas comosus TaxID=4615 RepID=A0A6P5F8J0_ANACO|nr:transcriptional adapter 2-beta isoform X1 [Ananas comosus]
MAQVLHLPCSIGTPIHGSSCALLGNPNPRWAALQKKLSRKGRHSCFFSDGRKQEQAKKALEQALGQKKTEFEKWNKEIEKRKEMGGGGTAGRGGWFGGGGGWFGWFGDDRFWEEAKQAIIAVIGIVSLYLLLAKGNVLFNVVSNSLLFMLRRFRDWFTYVLSHFPQKSPVPLSVSEPQSVNKSSRPMSAKERVVSKWGMD